MYSGVQASNLAILAGAAALVLSYFGIVVPVEEVQVVLGAALVIVGTISSWIVEWNRGDTNFIGTVKAPI